MHKAQQHEAIRERAREALRNLYHNATPDYPRDLRGRSEEEAQAWFNGAAEFEIEYLKDGGAYGSDYRKTLSADCNAGKYASAQARAYYVAKGMRAMELERADCGALTGWRALEIAVERYGKIRPGIVQARIRTLRNRAAREGWKRNDSLWERIGEYGTLYQYGRGGRTLAPDRLVEQRGGSSFRIREDYADDLPIGDVVELIRIVESFNAYVETWCSRENLGYMWCEHCACEDEEKRAQRKREREEVKQSARRELVRRCFC